MIRNLSMIFNTNRFICSEAFKSVKNFHTTIVNLKERDRRFFLQNHKAPEEGTDGERLVGVDVIKRKEDMFVDESTPNLLFNGVKYSKIPICHIKVSYNNTIIQLTNHEGKGILIRSCGIEGFKNARKGTNVAAQATAITLSTKAVRNGITDVRVIVKGLGPGRASSIRGLTMGGLNIVSVTDDTPIPRKVYPRPRKARRI